MLAQEKLISRIDRYVAQRIANRKSEQVESLRQKWNETRGHYCGAANARGSKTVWIEFIFPSVTWYHEQKKVVTLGAMKS